MATTFTVRINKNQLNKTLKSTLSKKKARELAYNEAVEKANKAKKETLSKFNKHPVTEEIEAGASAPNISGTVSPEGNLFSFIGFKAGSNPIEVLRQYLKLKGRVYKNSKMVKGENRVNYVFRVDGPDKTVAENLTPLPFEKGLSWVRGIEKGISNIGNYIFRETQKGRSKMGIQAKGNKKQARPAAFFTPTTYFSAIIDSFKESLKS
tara:strand:- start:3280 stop:3903 length:624 start_codon:yes stop_codon:yes gene_type:complete